MAFLINKKVLSVVCSPPDTVVVVVICRYLSAQLKELHFAARDSSGRLRTWSPQKEDRRTGLLRYSCRPSIASANRWFTAS